MEMISKSSTYRFDAFLGDLRAASKAGRAWATTDTGNLTNIANVVTADLQEAPSARAMLALFVRNVFLCLSLPARAGVPGDTNSRADLIVDLGVKLGIGELEQNTDVIDSVRRLLADVAIAVSRGRIEADAIVPLVVCVNLPNRRSDYYELIRNVKGGLGLAIHTISVPTLLALLYLDLDHLDIADRFLLDDNNHSLESDVAELAGGRLDPTLLRLKPLK